MEESQPENIPLVLELTGTTSEALGGFLYSVGKEHLLQTEAKARELPQT